MMKKKIFAFMILFVILCTIITMAPVMQANATTVKTNEEKYAQTYGYSMLETDQQRAAYTKIADALLNVDASVVLPTGHGVTMMDVWSMLDAMVQFDLPELFYFNGSINGGTEADGSMVIYFTYEYEGVKYNTFEGANIDKVKQAKANFDSTVNSIIAGIPADADTEYKKGLYVLRYLCEKISYDYSYAPNVTVETALTDGKGVCEEYACAYAVIMNKLGIKTWVVTSATHAWNVSWIKGNCVYTDVTWADNDNGTIDYEYFNTTLEKMSKYQKHTLSKKYADVLPSVCNHTEYEYKPEIVKVFNITLSVPSTLMTEKNGTMRITAQISPQNATDKTLIYSSSNKNVVKVSSNGTITAVGEGTATITVKSNDGGASESIEITVDFPHVHDMEKVSEKAATCTKDGREAYYHCKSCNNNYTDKNGTKLITDMSSLTIPATGHTEKAAVEENRTEATCVQNGQYDSVVYCKTCNAELSRTTKTIPATGHVYKEAKEENRVEPVCETAGSYDVVLYCKTCNTELERITKPIAATGHTASEPVTENQILATCTQDGSYDLITRCSTCNSVMECVEYVISATGHGELSTQQENRKEPTCTQDGSYDIVSCCVVCEQEVKRETVFILSRGHNAEEWFSDEEYHWQQCNTCNEEMPNSREVHMDQNKDGKCDICSHTVKIEDPTPGPTDPTTPTEPIIPTEPTEPTIPSEPPTEPTVPTEPTNPTDPVIPTIPTEPTNPTAPDNSEPNVDNHEKPSGPDGDDTGNNNTGNDMKMVIIITLVSLFIFGAVMVFIILRK